MREFQVPHRQGCDRKRPRGIFPEQLLEVLDRVRIRRPFRLGKPAEVPRRRVVPNLLLGVGIGHLPRCPEHDRTNQRPKMRWSPRLALKLAHADRLDDLLQLGPVDLVRHQHQAVVLVERDHRPRRSREELRLPAALPSGRGHASSPRASRLEVTIAPESDITSRRERSEFPGKL